MLEAEPVDLVEVARRAMEAAEPLADRKGSELRLRGAADRRASPRSTPAGSTRILRNLVVNAVEHGEGRPVEVTVAADRHAVAVTVRDHGVGLRPGESALVFNRFWRADPARARTTGGTGLGLAIALEDAHLHGGWLQAWGGPGDGCNFRLTLPRRSARRPGQLAAPARARGRARRPPGPAGRGRARSGGTDEPPAAPSARASLVDRRRAC